MNADYEYGATDAQLVQQVMCAGDDPSAAVRSGSVMASTMTKGPVLPAGISAGLMGLPGFLRTDHILSKIQVGGNRPQLWLAVSVRGVECSDATLQPFEEYFMAREMTTKAQEAI